MLNEKDFFTTRRIENLQAFPELQILEKFGSYCMVPLDVPKFVFPELVNWFFENSKPTYKLKPDVANDKYGGTAFDAIDVMPTDEFDQNDIWSLNIRQEFMIDFKHVYETLMDVLPFVEISRIRMWSSTCPIPFHRDHTKFVDFPGAFRIMLYDTNPCDTLSVIQSKPDSIDDLSKKFYLTRLDDTNTYVWNNLRTKHGSDYIPSFRKIIIILDRYKLDIKKYSDLLERSIQKYQNLCFVSTSGKAEYLNEHLL